MSRSFSLLLTFLVIALVGCNQNPTTTVPGSTAAPAASALPAGGVGTIDMMKIGRQTGIVGQIERQGAALKQQVDSVAQQKDAEFQALRKKYGEKPTEEQTKEINELFNKSRQAVQTVQNQADQSFREFSENRINVLRLAVKGPLDKVVKKRGLTVVLQEDKGGIYWKSDTVDITEEVLELISSAAAAGMPTLPAAQPTASAPKTTAGAK